MENDVPKLTENAAISLRKSARETDENKRSIKSAGGIPALVAVLRQSRNLKVREEVSGTLWTLSECDELKRPILERATDTVVKQLIIPGSGVSDSRAYNPNLFKNATGILRNVSAATDAARKVLRETPNLVTTLVHFLHLALSRGEADTTPVENVVCVLRNLSYRCQEVEDPDFDRVMENLESTTKESKSAQRVFCCCRPRVSNENEFLHKEEEQGSSQATEGVSLLWQLETAKLYLRILADDSSSTTTLEAATGAIQNLCACNWQASVEIRATVRKEKGLPTLIEMLRLADDDSLNCTAAYAIRNLIIDQRNKELVGKYAIYSLVDKLPQKSYTSVSDSTVIAVLAVIYLTVRDNSHFSTTLHETGGTKRLIYLSTSHSNAKVIKYASQILRAMWQHKDLRDVFKQAGHRKEDFFVSLDSADEEMMALVRPISTQGPERPANEERGGD